LGRRSFSEGGRRGIQYAELYRFITHVSGYWIARSSRR
jgi:hypothetical protein